MSVSHRSPSALSTPPSYDEEEPPRTDLPTIEEILERYRDGKAREQHSVARLMWAARVPGEFNWKHFRRHTAKCASGQFTLIESRRHDLRPTIRVAFPPPLPIPNISSLSSLSYDSEGDRTRANDLSTIILMQIGDGKTPSVVKVSCKDRDALLRSTTNVKNHERRPRGFTNGKNRSLYNNILTECYGPLPSGGRSGMQSWRLEDLEWTGAGAQPYRRVKRTRPTDITPARAKHLSLADNSQSQDPSDTPVHRNEHDRHILDDAWHAFDTATGKKGGEHPDTKTRYFGASIPSMAAHLLVVESTDGSGECMRMSIPTFQEPTLFPSINISNDDRPYVVFDHIKEQSLVSSRTAQLREVDCESFDSELSRLQVRPSRPWTLKSTRACETLDASLTAASERYGGTRYGSWDTDRIVWSKESD